MHKLQLNLFFLVATSPPFPPIFFRISSVFTSEGSMPLKKENPDEIFYFFAQLVQLNLRGSLKYF